jgi:Tim44-like domain
MPIRLPSWRVILALWFCAGLVLAPALAEARAGSSFGSRPSSFGSRGWRSYENNGAQPSGSLSGSGYGAGNSGLGSGGFFQRHPFLTGLAGGAFGAWLFGHGGGMGFGGGLLRLLLLGLAVWFVVRLVRRLMSRTGPPGIMPMPRSAGAAAVRAPPDRGHDINLSDADLGAFQEIHARVQEAWSAADLSRLRRLMTPEMLRRFSEELNRNSSRGVRNIVSGVKLLKGELTESWDEGDRQYATARLHWRALDYVLELGRSPGDADFVAGGDPRAPVEAEEMWTFVRQRGGPWLLSAIQQV